MQDNFTRIAQTLEGTRSVPAVASEVSKHWKALSESEKDQYKQRATAGLEEHYKTNPRPVKATKVRQLLYCCQLSQDSCSHSHARSFDDTMAVTLVLTALVFTGEAFRRHVWLQPVHEGEHREEQQYQCACFVILDGLLPCCKTAMQISHA